MLNVVSETRRNDLKDFNFGQLLSLLSNENKKKFRRLEKLKENFIKNKFGIIFNKTCLNEGLLPKYTNLRVHDPVVRKEEFTTDYRRKLVEYELQKCEREKSVIETDINSLIEDISTSFESQELHEALITKLDDIIEQKSNALSSRTTKKLNSLYNGKILLLNKDNTPYINL